MRTKCLRIGFLGIIFLIIGLALATQQLLQTEALALEKATMQLHWKVSGMHVPFIVAWDKGFFKDEGIDMTVKEGAGSSATIKLIAAGKETFGMAGTNVNVKGIARGMPVLQVAQIEASKQYCLISKSESNITAPQDLVGKIVAGSGSGGTSALFNAFLAVNKIPQEKVTFLNAGRARLDALATGKAHGTLGLGMDDPVRLKGKGVKNPQVMLFADYGIPDVGDGVIVNLKTVKENPELIRKFIRAYIKGVQHTFMDIEGSAAIAKKRFPMTKADIVIVQLNKLRWLFPSPIGWQDPKGVEAIRQITAKYEGVTEAVNMPLGKFFTNKFLPY
jgi:NitT/TauT family transport system substrate-binding protein